MELVLEEAVCIPEGGVLSLKVGNTQRQGPASTLGSRFCFGSMHTGPLDVEVELLAPVAPAQRARLNGANGECAADFGCGTRVRLRRRDLAKVKRTKVDVTALIDTRHLPSEKIHMAQKAAQYLEEHDIVQTLQEILHGLLLDRPDDPFAFIDERLAHARSLASQRQAEAEKERTDELQRCGLAAKRAVEDAVASVLARREARAALQQRQSGSAAAASAAEGRAVDVGCQLGGGVDEDFMARAPDEAIVCASSRLTGSARFSASQRTSGSEGSPFDGCWLEGAEVHTISGTELCWANGVCTDVEFTADNSFSVVLYGKVYDACLEDGGLVLHWCDGDLWHRAEGEPDDRQPVKVNKVEVLLGSMHSLKRSLPMVLPALPQHLRDMLVDPALSQECQQRFRELAQSDSGKLSPQDLLPVVGHMSSARRQSITPEQCQRFAEIFDVNQDGAIERCEFTDLVRFSLIASFLESAEGEDVATMVQKEDQLFQEFLQTLEQDLEVMDQIVPVLPQWLQDHLKSEEFKSEWLEYFDKLDQDKNEALDPVELLPEVLRLSEAHPLTIDVHKSRQFTKIFDKRKDGVIWRDEWLELAKFLSVMCYLGGEQEADESGALLQRRLQLPAKRAEQLLAMLEENCNRLSEVIPLLPKSFRACIMSDEFVEASLGAFQRLDQANRHELGAPDLVSLVFDVCKAHGRCITRDEGVRIATLFCRDRSTIPKEEAVDLARFALSVVLLSRRDSGSAASGGKERPQQPEPPSEPRTQGRSSTKQLLRALQADAAKLGEVVVFLPQHVKTPLLTSAFAEECLAAFDGLDRSASGALAPEVLVPAVVRLGQSWSMPATEERCLEFLGILSSQHSAAVRRGEFASFTHFLLALAYFETEEGKVAVEEAPLALGKRRVEELLAMLERDRQSVHKVVPLLPSALVEHLASEDFVASSRKRFAELDVGRLGHLRPSDLVPIVVELSLAQPDTVDAEDCRRFLAIFTVGPDGVMNEDEFLEFSRFLCIMSFLHSEEGQKQMHEGVHVMDNSMKVQDLQAMLRTDRYTLEQALPYLPGWLQKELLVGDFDATWLRHFEELDASKRGLLQHGQLSGAIMECPVARYLGLDEGRYERFAASFDDTHSGVLKKADCPDFVRFLLTMMFLESQEGQKRLDVQALVEQPGALCSRASSPPDPMADHLGTALCARKMRTDLERYRVLAARLEQENAMQREHILRMEAVLTARGEAAGQPPGLQAHLCHADTGELSFRTMPVPVG